MWKFCFVFVFLIASVLCSDGGINDAKEQEVTQEEECMRAGGVCMLRANCPTNKICEAATCPKQSSLGVVCCHGLMFDLKRCQQLGGDCMESCPERITLARASDCDEGEKCCALVL